MNLRLKASLFAFISNIIWGTTFYASAVTLQYMEPFTLMFFRFSIASILIFLYIKILKIKIIFPKFSSDLIILVLYSLFGFVFLYSFQLYGLKYISSGLSASIMLLSPFILVIINSLMTLSINYKNFIGVMFSIIGAWFLVYSKVNSVELNDFDENLGILLTFISACFLAISIYTSEKLIKNYDPISFNFWSILISLPFILICATYEISKDSEAFIFDYKTLSLVVYLGLVCTGIAFFLWNKALEYSNSSLIVSTMHLKTPVAIFIGVYFGHELINQNIVLGILLISIGLAVSNLTKVRRKFLFRKLIGKYEKVIHQSFTEYSSHLILNLKDEINIAYKETNRRIIRKVISIIIIFFTLVITITGSIHFVERILTEKKLVNDILIDSNSELKSLLQNTKSIDEANEYIANANLDVTKQFELIKLTPEQFNNEVSRCKPILKSFICNDFFKKKIFSYSLLQEQHGLNLVLKKTVDIKSILYVFNITNFFFLVIIIFILVLMFFVWLIYTVFIDEIPKEASVLLNELEDKISSRSVEIDSNKFKTLEFYNLAVSIEKIISANEKLKVNAKLGEMASQISHDIRSPLMVLEIAIEDFENLDDEMRMLVKEGVLRIKDIANGLLDYRRNSETIDQAINVVNIFETLEFVVKQKRVQFKTFSGTHFTLINECKDTVFARINAVEFESILSNIINNSVEALLDNIGQVEIRLFQFGEVLSIEISDNGIGISSENMKKVGIEHFSFGKTNGNGIGVYSAAIKLKQWGGNLVFNSVEGEGTVVKISLPVYPHLEQ